MPPGGKTAEGLSDQSRAVADSRRTKAPGSGNGAAGKQGSGSGSNAAAAGPMTHKTGSTTFYPPSHWSGDGCSQQDLEARARQPVQAALTALAQAKLADDPRKALDWKGLKDFLATLLRPVPRKPRWAHSLRAFRNARIRYEASPKADEVGMLAVNTRLPPWGWVRGKGCRGGWMMIGPHAYVCRRHLVWAKEKPLALHQPPMPADQITPGQYAYVRAAGAPLYPSRKAAKQKKPSRILPMGFFVRFKRFCRIDGKNYWKTTKNWYIPISRLARHVPSQFAGVDLEKTGLKLPVAFTLRQKRIYDSPGGRVTGRLPRHAAVQVLGSLAKAGRRYYRIGPCRWIRARGARAAWPSTPPPGTTRHQQWVDVNLARQTLVAYEGNRPVFATMVSTGLDDHATKHGIFRVYWKVAETDMTNEMGAAEEYMAESVPWTLFFWKGQALHGAYWHDFFGVQRSHGCVNLAPRDARFVYEWSNPHLPDGWIYRWLGVKYPGLLVRIRRKDGDLVRFMGLARKFAPPQAVAARDEAYKKRIEAETLEMLAKTKDQKNASSQGTKEQGDSNPPQHRAGASTKNQPIRRVRRMATATTPPRHSDSRRARPRPSAPHRRR